MQAFPIDPEMAAELDMLNELNCGGRELLEFPRYRASAQTPIGDVDDIFRQMTGEPDAMAPTLSEGGHDDSFFGTIPACVSQFGLGSIMEDSTLAKPSVGLQASLKELFDEPTKESDDDYEVASAAAFKMEMRKKVFKGLARALRDGTLEDVLRELTQEHSAQPIIPPEKQEDLRARWSWPPAASDSASLERVAMKQGLKTKVFEGMEVALNNGALEMALHEIALDNAEEEAHAVRAEFARPLFRTLALAVKDAAVQEGLQLLAEEFAAEERIAMKTEFHGPLFACLLRAMDDATLEPALAQVALEG